MDGGTESEGSSIGVGWDDISTGVLELDSLRAPVCGDVSACLGGGLGKLGTLAPEMYNSVLCVVGNVGGSCGWSSCLSCVLRLPSFQKATATAIRMMAPPIPPPIPPASAAVFEEDCESGVAVGEAVPTADEGSLVAGGLLAIVRVSVLGDVVLVV